MVISCDEFPLFGTGSLANQHCWNWENFRNCVFGAPPKVSPSGREGERDVICLLWLWDWRRPYPRHLDSMVLELLLSIMICNVLRIYSVHCKTCEQESRFPSIRVAKYLQHNICQESKLLDRTLPALLHLYLVLSYPRRLVNKNRPISSKHLQALLPVVQAPQAMWDQIFQAWSWSPIVSGDGLCSAVQSRKALKKNREFVFKEMILEHSKIFKKNHRACCRSPSWTSKMLLYLLVICPIAVEHDHRNRQK